MSTLNDNCSILVTLLLLLTIELLAQWSNCTPFNNLYMRKGSTNPFHAYNQYTVDQLLEKAPSVLEFAETSTITQNESDNDPSKLPNQNVFQSGNLNNSSSSSHAIHLKKSKHPYLVNTKFKSLKTINQILSSIRFNCSGFPEGYYADLDFNCRIFHYCKRGMIKFTFNCPVNAIFNQKQLTCENNLRNPIKMCKSSTKYFFLNSMLYPNSNNNHNELSPISEQLKEPDHWMIDSTTELPLFSSTEMTFRPTTSQPKQLKRSKINKKNSKPKWSAVEMLNSFQQIPSPMAEIPMPTESTPTNPHENEPFSTAFSIWEPDIVSTSSPSPMDQIMAPKWYHDTVSVNDFTNIFDNKNTNIYSLDSSSTSTEMEDNNNLEQSSTPSYLGLFDDIETSTISMDTKNNIKHKSNKKENENDKFETKFNIDWDDADMSAGEFSPIRINQRPKQHKPIFNQYSSTPPPDTDENNFLYGKPIEIPDNVINSNEFNPVSFESIMANIPQTTPEIDMGVSIIPNFYNYYNQNQPEHQNQNPLPTLNKNSNNFFSQKMSALFNMLGNKIGRRWTKRGIVGNSRLSFPMDDFLLTNRRYELLDPNNIQLQNLQSQIHQYLPITTEQSFISSSNNNNNKNRYSQLTWPQPSLLPSNNYYRN